MTQNKKKEKAILPCAEKCKMCEQVKKDFRKCK